MSRLSEFPPRLRASTEHSEVIYVRAKEYYAVRNCPPGAPRVFSINDGEYSVIKGQPKRDDESVSAVYEFGATLAVPTGRVFVRFAIGVDASRRKSQLLQVGYDIDQLLSYAPNAAWLRDADDDAAVALSRVEELERLDDVENVEPQLLTPRSLR
jgi:hypothetical protein